MSYLIGFRPSARKAVDKLPSSVFGRVKLKVDAPAENPRPPGCVKLAGHESLFRLRTGDWRVVCAVDDARQTVTVTIVAHRRESYRGL